MPNFQYIASNPKGESVRGTAAAFDKSELTKLLQSRGLFLVSCRVESDPVNAVIPRPSATPRPSMPPRRPSAPSSSYSEPAPPRAPARRPAAKFQGKPRGKVTLKELVVFTRQISISLNAGMTFVDALQGLASNSQNPKLAYILQSILRDILAGKKFSEALEAQPDVFDPHYTNMAAAGEAGGFMPNALNRVAEYLEREMDLRSKIRSALIYPIVIGIVATIVVTGMMIFIVPTFVHVFEEMNAPLPLPTRMLIGMSVFVRHGGFLCPLGLILVPVFIGALRKRNETVRAFYDERILRIPLFGKIKTLEIITRFIRTFASLVENGVAVLMSLGVARQVVDNRTIEKVVDQIYASVQQGNGISPVLYKSPHFPVLVANMVATGEKTGTIPEVLTKMADYYDAEVATAVRDLLTMMEPLLIVVMAVIVGFIIAGLMLPTFEMSSLVH